MLDPPPADFRRACGLDRGRILDVLRAGVPGTAMMSFADRLDEAEMRAVAAFVERRFVRGGPPASAYHTAENGWPRHRERYGAAFPFARGDIPVDVPEERLSPEQRAGLALFRGACTSCHEGRTAGTAGGEGHEEEEYEHGWQGPPSPPLPADAPLAVRAGERLYLALCAACHGRDGTAENWVGEFLRPRPPDLRGVLARLDERELACVIRRGIPGTSMPAFARRIDEAGLRGLIAYLRAVIAVRPAAQGAKAPAGTDASSSMPSITVAPMNRPTAH